MTSKNVLVVLAVSYQMLAAQDARVFDVASIHRSSPDVKSAVIETLPGGRFVAHGIYVRGLVKLALGPAHLVIRGAPDWFDEMYDVEAKADGAGEMTEEGLAAPLLALMRDRFGLVTHEETIQETVYLLEQMKSGAKVKPSAPGTEYGDTRMAEGVTVKGETLAHFAMRLQNFQDIQAPVIDRTALEGKYDFFVPYIHVPQENEPPLPTTAPAELTARLSTAYSSTFVAVQTLGLQLKPEKRPATAVVIDKIHRPAEN